MNNEFIPYEEALALKELGLKLKLCFGFFISNIDEPNHINSYVTFRGSEPYEPDKDCEVTLVPLYQQAFRWFRD